MEFATTLSTALSPSVRTLVTFPIAIAILAPFVIAALVFLVRRRASQENASPKKKQQ